MTNKVIFGINLITALLLVFSMFTSLIAPSRFPSLSLLSLLTLPIIGVNIVFAIYWLILWNRRFFVSTLLVVLAHFYFGPFFMGQKLNLKTVAAPVLDGIYLTLTSHNVHLFNLYGDEAARNSTQKEFDYFISASGSEVLCLQEFTKEHKVDFSDFPHQYIYFKPPYRLMGHAILSKYPMVNQGSLEFDQTANNAIYADLLIGQDTIRVYNLHLQSLGINPEVDIAQQGGAESIRTKMSNTFVRQQSQLNHLMKHLESVNYPVVIAGDLNNTAFSYVYTKLATHFNDAFQIAGSGLGATYYFNGLPLRIDFIFTDPKISVQRYWTEEHSSSDHLPITAKLKLNP